jgi:large subunit ribosomal protein L28
MREMLKTRMDATVQGIRNRKGGIEQYSERTGVDPTGKNRKYPNLQKKKVYIPELKKSITIRVSTKGMRTINKNGAFTTLKKAGILK